MKARRAVRRREVRAGGGKGGEEAGRAGRRREERGNRGKVRSLLEAAGANIGQRRPGPGLTANTRGRGGASSSCREST